MIHIRQSGEGTQSVILLHGWGQSSLAFLPVQKHLERNFSVYNIDLPGFGKSDFPITALSTLDYAKLIKAIVDEKQLKNPILIGHSFGGRVAIQYSSIYPVHKLVLVDSAGIVHKKKWSYYIKIYHYKLLKRIVSLPFLKKYETKLLNKYGSKDYQKANPIMKQILVKAVNEDLREKLKSIDCPTLLIWGTNDQETPIQDAYLMNRCLRDGGVVEIKQAGHFSYLDNLPFFNTVIDTFFMDDKGGIK